MTNTNLNGSARVGDWAGIMARLTTLSRHLAAARHLTQGWKFMSCSFCQELAPDWLHKSEQLKSEAMGQQVDQTLDNDYHTTYNFPLQVVLPFASDQILAHLARLSGLALFQNVYRSTVTERGMEALAAGPCRLALTHILLCLNTHANVPAECVAGLLRAAPQLRVLEFGGTCKTKSLYFQGGDAKRRHEIFSVVARLGESEPSYTNQLARLLIFREGNRPVDFAAVLRHCPHVTELTLFGWECIRVERDSWRQLAGRLECLELVGIGFNGLEVEERESSVKFDWRLFGGARRLKRLKLAGWGDTVLELDHLLQALPQLNELYVEDVKIVFPAAVRKGYSHQLASLSVFHCSTGDLNLIQCLAAALPHLVSLTISSLYLDHPNRGLPFHFHLPRADEAADGPDQPAAPARHPFANLRTLAELTQLEELHLNVSYTLEHADHDFTLPVLLIRKFGRLSRLYLDNYIRDGNLCVVVIVKSCVKLAPD